MQQYLQRCKRMLSSFLVFSLLIQGNAFGTRDIFTQSADAQVSRYEKYCDPKRDNYKECLAKCEKNPKECVVETPAPLPVKQTNTFGGGVPTIQFAAAARTPQPLQIVKTARTAIAGDFAFTDDVQPDNVVDVAVGEVVEYELEITFTEEDPNGAINNLVLTDNIPQGMGLLGINPFTGTPEIVRMSPDCDGRRPLAFNGIAFQPGTFGVNSPASIIGASGQDLQLRSGLNIPFFATADGITGNNTFCLYYQVAVLDTPQTDLSAVTPKTTNHTNSVTATYENQGNAYTSSAVSDIVRQREPELQVQVSGQPNPAQILDTVVVTVTVDHTAASRADAHQNQVTFTVPADLAVNTNFATDGLDNTGSGADDESGFFPFFNVGTNTFTWDFSTTGVSEFNTLPYGNGDQIQMQFEATIVSGNFQVPLPVDLEYSVYPDGVTSADGANSRSAGVVPASAFAPVQTSGFGSIVLGAPSTHTLDKTIVSTSTATSPAAQWDTNREDYAIGETIRYQIEFTLPEGTYPDLVLTDTAQFLGLPVIGPATFDTSVTPTFATYFPAFTTADVTRTDQYFADGVFDTLTVNLGTLTIPVGDGPQTFVVEYEAIVQDIPSNISDGSDRSNMAQATYTGLTAQDELTDMVFTDIVEPELTIDIQTTTNTATIADFLTYTVTITNNGTSPAYDVDVTNTVPAMLVVNDSFMSDGLDNTGDGATAETAPHSFYTPGTQTFNWNQANTGNADFAAIAPGQSVVVEYQVQVNPAGSGFVGTLTNPVTVQSSSMPGVSFSERTYTSSDAFDVSIDEPNIEIEKTAVLLVDADGNNLVSAGDTIEYTLEVSNTGTTPATGVEITDAIPAEVNSFNLTTSIGILPGPVVDNSIAAPGGANGEGELILSGLELQPFPGFNSQATITYEVIVDAGIPDGTFVVNQADASAALEGGTGDSDQQQLIVSAPVDSPDLTTSNKQVVDVDGDNVIDGGDILEYTIEIINTGNSDASGVNISDHLPANVSNVTVTQLPTTGSLNIAQPPNGVNGNGEVQVLGMTIAAGATQTIRYQVTVDTGLPEFTAITNSVTVYDNTSTAVATDSVTVHTPIGEIGLEKVLATSTPFFYSGEIATYLVALENTGTSPSLEGLLLQDAIPAGASYISNSLEMQVGSVTTQITDVLDADNGDYNQTTPGEITMVVPAIAPGERVFFRYDLRVPRLQTPGQSTNTVRAVIPHFMTPVVQNGQPVENDHIISILPAIGDFMTLEKNILNPPAVIEPGDLLQYEIILENNYPYVPNPIQSVQLIDLLPAGLIYVPGTMQQHSPTSVSLSDALDGDVADYNITNPGDITFTMSPFGLGDAVRFTFQARVSDTITSTTQVTNRVRVRDAAGEWIRNGQGQILQDRANITVVVDNGSGGGNNGGGNNGGGNNNGGNNGNNGGSGGGASGGNPNSSIWNTHQPITTVSPYSLNLSISGDVDDKITRDTDDIAKMDGLPKTGFVSERLAQAYNAESVFTDMDMNADHYMAMVALHSQGVLRAPESMVYPEQQATYADLLGMLMLGQDAVIHKDFDTYFQKVYNYEKDAQVVDVDLVVAEQYLLEAVETSVPMQAVLQITLDTLGKSPRGSEFEYYQKSAVFRNLLTEDLKALDAQQTLTRAQLAEVVFRALQMKDENAEQYTESMKLDVQKLGIEDYEMNRSMLSETSVWLSTLNDGGAFYKDLRDMGEHTVLFAHSSHYSWHKTEQGPVFAAVAKNLGEGDTFTLTENGVETTFRVMTRQVVSADDTSALEDVPDNVDVTLFTCDLQDLSKRVVLYAVAQ